MPIWQPFGRISPTSVTEMPYLLRYCLVTTRNGAKAYDLYETMNRQAYFREQGRYRWDAASYNIESLMAIRAGTQNQITAQFYDPSFCAQGITEPQTPTRLNTYAFWHQHGVEIDMRVYDSAVWEQEALESVETIEAAHELWNLSQVDFDTSDTTWTLDEDEINELMGMELLEIDELEIDN